MAHSSSSESVSSQLAVVISRPEGQADSLMSQIKSEIDSINLLHLPLIEICSTDSSSIKGANSVESFDKAIFISGNAVRFFEFSQFQIDKYFAVGESTASQLETRLKKGGANSSVAYPEEMNADGLLEMAEMKQVDGEQIILVKGRGGRSLITDVLTDRGAKVTELDLYQRKLPSFETQQRIKAASQNSLVWIITSGEALVHLHRILGLAESPEHGTQVIISSERLRQLAVQKGFKIVAQSAGATDRQLVQCVKSLFSDQEKSSHE